MRGNRIGRHRNAGEIAERLEIAEADIPWDAHDRGGKVVTGSVHTTQECRQLELPNRHIESYRGEARLQHLLERGFAAADREQLKARALVERREQVPRRVGR